MAFFASRYKPVIEWFFKEPKQVELPEKTV